tara:strand:- start:224 stop:493 length:270 start_codon:yes stop_codon:yes gene_type:complete
MKIGDLVWYNTAGSKQTGIVLEIRTMKHVITYGEQCEVMKIHWSTNGSGPRPAMYSVDGNRIYGTDQLTSYVQIKSKGGIGLFKVISKA